MISGIFENCIGTRDLDAALKYWAEFGYREVKRGHLDPEAARSLYGHASPLISVRLQNGDSAKHSSLRLMYWQEIRNQGLENTLPMVAGSRWFASLVRDIFLIADAFADDNANGGNWIYSEPVRGIEAIGHEGTGLFNRFVGVREMFVIGEETRQAFFQRYNYNRDGYGTIPENSPLGVSEGTHSSFVTTDHASVIFYEEVFGLTMTLNNRRSGYLKPATRQILMLQEGQEFCYSMFNSPEAIAGVFQVYTPLYSTPDKREFAQPGSLGVCLFTYRVDDIDSFHDHVLQSEAYDVSAIITNEFGERSFGFFAPDGMYWVFVT
jgi:hypothetical protein